MQQLSNSKNAIAAAMMICSPLVDHDSSERRDVGQRSFSGKIILHSYDRITFVIMMVGVSNFLCFLSEYIPQAMTG